ncbi:hypothetical protein [Roseicyclus sp.]|uniref:hypothetical protein n=1 Tax=Roseicyclus sp. TaxID=1914329 RepID=UPI003F9FD4CC
MTTGSGWDGILAPGEEILWQGRPDSAVVWSDALTDMLLGGAFFTLFACAWIGFAVTIMVAGDFRLPFMLFPLAGLPFLGVGLYMLGGHVVYDAYLRSVTWYTLTDRTAYVATAPFGWRRLHRHAIRDMAFLELEEGAPGRVLFAKRSARGRKIRRRGFRRIADARHVYGRMRDLRGNPMHMETA